MDRVSEKRKAELRKVMGVINFLIRQPSSTFPEGRVPCLHHGDCLGADALAHQVAVDLDWDIIIHPPTKDAQRAFCSRDGEWVAVLLAKPYMVRNRMIVNDSSELLAMPSDPTTPVLRSGTWATIRYARKCNREITFV